VKMFSAVRWIALGIATAAAFAAGAQAPERNTLRIGVAAADVPLTTGQADNGGEGMRFMGYTAYDPLIIPAAATAKQGMRMKPGLATSWSLDPKDNKRWIFKIRPNVKFHDGSVFSAEAAVWNLDKLLNKDAPQFDAKQASQGRSRIPAIKTYRAIDSATLEVMTAEPNAYLPYQIAWVAMSSPAQWEKVGKSWEAFAKTPSGTGPWKVVKVVPRERVELVRNDDYWDKAAIPAAEKLVIVPVPDSNTRVSALRSGQLDWIEQPAPDSVAALKSGGFSVVAGPVLQNWCWTLNRTEGSPWNDVRVRKAANLAINRAGLAAMTSGLVLPSTGFIPPGTEWYGKPNFTAKYDPAAARKLLAEAGYGPGKPLKLSALITSSDSGQARGLLMNEAIQQDLAKVGIEVSFEVLEWNTLLSVWRSGSRHASSKGAQAVNVGYFMQDPFAAFERHVRSDLIAPNGTNWGHYIDADMDKLLAEARQTFDPAQQNKVLVRIHEKIVNEALFLFLVHDLSPVALSPRVTGYVHPKNTVVAYDWSQIKLKN
jgi:peptide/nickel transport system substrate-binding protein